MRLWSLHPSLLDSKGLVACWRETLLAQKVLAGKTSGYTGHPQLVRWRATADPQRAVGAYLQGLWLESVERGYRFDAERILEPDLEQLRGQLPVTSGQLLFEHGHLLRKLQVRDPARGEALAALDGERIAVHPLFHVVPGPVESWEKDARA